MVGGGVLCYGVSVFEINYIPSACYLFVETAFSVRGLPPKDHHIPIILNYAIFELSILAFLIDFFGEA